VISLRLEEETIREIEELSQLLGVSKSDIIREAIREYLVRAAWVKKTKEVYMRV